MNTRIIAIAAALGGFVVGVVGVGAFAHPRSSPSGVACPTSDTVAEAKADAIARQLHAHDHDAYVPHPAPPMGELPKATKTDPSHDAQR